MIPDNEREQRIAARGKELLDSVRSQAPDLFSPNNLAGKVLDRAMADERFKDRFLRFLDVAAGVSGSTQILRKLREYFGDKEQDIPAELKWGGSVLNVGGALGAKLSASALRGYIEKRIRRVLAGETHKEALKTLGKLRKDGCAATLIRLGSAALSDEEADACEQDCLELLNALENEQAKWKALGDKKLDWGVAPLPQLSVTPSAFCSRLKPVDPEGSVEAAYERLAPVYRRVRDLGGFLCLNMEGAQRKEITIELYKRLRSAPDFRDYPHLGLTLRSNLRDTDSDLDALLAWAREEALPISIRLVKGARWEQENNRALQLGWASPVYSRKAETDAAFERQAALILENHDICALACATHNLRSLAAVLEQARRLRVPENRYEFQVAYGLGDATRAALRKLGQRVRVLCPYGGLQPGAGYLLRLFQEITSKDSFQRQFLAEKLPDERLLESPLTVLARLDEESAESPLEPQPASLSDDAFRNQPAADFSLPETRAGFRNALALVRGQLGKTHALRIDGQEVTSTDLIESVNSAAPEELVGRVCQASMAEIDQAVSAARRALPAWRETPVQARTEVLLKAADIARGRLYELAAWQVLEVGRQWDEACADVAEAVDFLEYYAREMRGLGRARRLGQAPGERNELLYDPLGVVAVISPWCSPLAAACGMSAAALAAGNAVVFKPSNLAPVTGAGLYELFHEAGLPSGLFNYTPGHGAMIGDYLVEHPDVACVAFAGSLETGARVVRNAAKLHSEQLVWRRALCELSGQNAILVDEDADLDLAIPEILKAAFSFQGQKNSSSSRLLAHDAIYDACVKRLVEAARSLKIGPAEDPANDLGPLVEHAAQKRVRALIENGRREGRLLLEREQGRRGFYAPLAIFEELDPTSQLSREEILGPVLTVSRVKTFEQALALVNAGRFGQSCAVFSRSPASLERARQELRVGDLLLNRATSDARVGRQPFGGLRLSGQGARVGGPDYLLQFLAPRVVAEYAPRCEGWLAEK